MEELPTVLAAGNYLRLMRKGNWEYAERPNVRGVVAIVALTDDGKLVLVEQYRPPMNTRVIEIPAGLVGDEAPHEQETLLNAAKRELREETGYHAAQMSIIASGPSSAGMSNEVITLCFAAGLTKAGIGGGIAGEDIVIHEILFSEVANQLHGWIAQGKLIDLKVYAAMYFIGVQKA